jgi:hypothetical protein
MNNLVIALFKNPTEASSAIYALEAIGIRESDISLLKKDSLNEDHFEIADSHDISEGVAYGAASAGILTAIVAGLTTVGSIATGGATLLASGPIVAMLAGGGAGAAAGGILGGLLQYGNSDKVQIDYQDTLEKGAVLIGVNYTDDNEQIIRNVLQESNPLHITESQ